MLEGSPVLRPMILKGSAEQIEVVNGCVFRSIPSSGRGSRGMAVGFLVMDEAAHFTDTNGNNSGDQLYQSLSPSIAQFGKLGKILLTSSPWIQSGLFFSLYSKASKGNLRAYTASEPSWVMNPTLSKDFLEEQKVLLGPEVFAAEYGAQWTNSLSSFLPAEVIDTCVNHERSILLPQDKFKGAYFLSLDPSKGGRDSYVAVIVHYDNNVLVVDKWHEFGCTWNDGGKKNQVSISEVESWIVQHNEVYGFRKIVLDQYNSQSTIQHLRSQTLNIEELTWTTPTKIQAFTKLRELFTSGSIELYQHSRSVQQLKNLIVEYRASGSWNVTGGAGVGVDDYCLALAGSALIAKNNEPWRWMEIYSMH